MLGAAVQRLAPRCLLAQGVPSEAYGAFPTWGDFSGLG